MNEHRDSYLLSCPCGRNLVVQPRQAGETLRCQCGRENTVPTMREIRRLPAAETAVAADAPRWGSSQRLLLVGLVVMVVAAVLAVVLFSLQYSLSHAIANDIQKQSEHVRTFKPWETLQWYRRNLAPGLRTPEESRIQRYRQMFDVGKAIAAIAGIAGVVLIAIGIAGLRKTNAKRPEGGG